MAIVPIPGNPFEIYTYTVPDSTVQRKALRYNGKDVYLGGIYAPTAKLDGGFDSMMQYLSSVENNYFRHWLVNYFLLDPNQSKDGEPFRKRYCPFYFNTQTKEYDLLSYNDADGDAQSYFARLRSMIAAARKYNIIVQLTVFDACGMRTNPTNPQDSAMRWPWNPWNTDNNKQPYIVGNNGTAFPTFYETATRADMRQAQQNFVRHVVERTVEYWNVVYEVMNEPGGPEDDANLTLRAKWADETVGVINNITKGRRLIFFNDFHNGKDTNKWRALGLPNYEALDGVTFHGDPNNVNPDGNSGWHFRSEKVIQASSDGFNEETRKGRSWNRVAADYLFDRKMVFQAETLSTEAAYGIKLAAKGPTVITRAPFIGNWDKTGGPGPDFFVQFNTSGRYLAMDTVNDVQLPARGRLQSFTADRFVVLPDGQTTPIEYAYTLSGNTLKYHLATDTDPSHVLTFNRFYGPLEPFVYWWEKVGQNEDSTRPLFNLYFRPDNTFTARALDTGALMVTGTVLSISDELGQIALHNNNTNTNETWSYRFYNAGKGMRLTNAAGDHYAIYERRA